MLDLLEAMERHVSVVTDGRSADSPSSFTVYATRDLASGELVGEDDVSVHPPAKRKQGSHA